MGSVSLGAAGCLETTVADDAVDTTTETCSTATQPSEDDHRHYTFGDWTAVPPDETAQWEVTVVDIEFLTSFVVEESGETYEMPDEKQLGITTTRVTNTGSSLDTWESSDEFVVILPDDTVVEPESYFEHPEFTDVVSARELEELPVLEQYTPEGYPVYPGETETVQWVTTLPRDVARQSLRIGLKPRHDSQGYSIRWRPNRRC